MITTICRIELYSFEKGRKAPFQSGYRPLFDFPNVQSKISGKIDLINTNSFSPGMSDIVKISFIEGIINMQNLIAGTRFSYSEGLQALGEGEVLEIVSSK
jgi:translation elongation factor EF-Tu-like GTPase